MQKRPDKHAVIRIPQSLKTSLERLAEIYTDSVASGRMDPETEFGTPDLEADRLASWFVVAKLTEKELRRRGE